MITTEVFLATTLNLKSSAIHAGFLKNDSDHVACLSVISNARDGTGGIGHQVVDWLVDGSSDDIETTSIHSLIFISDYLSLRFRFYLCKMKWRPGFHFWGIGI